MTLRVLFDRVLVEIETPQTMTDNGLHIPERAQDERAHRVGRVVAVGPGYTTWNDDGQEVFITAPVEVGDRVCFAASWHGAELEHEGKSYRVLESDDVAAVVGEGVYLENMEL